MGKGYVDLRDPKMLIAKLSTKLSLNGFPVVPEDNIKALDALSSLPPDADLETVGHVLAGIYSRDGQMYEEFMEFWHRLFKLKGTEKGNEMQRGFYNEGKSLTEELVRRITENAKRRIESKVLPPISGDLIMR